MIYKISKKCFNKINSFYTHVAQKYSHTYSYELMCKNIDEAIDNMYKIENGLLRKIPTITKWKKCFMAKTTKWYYFYNILRGKYENSIIIVLDVCHAQNMHEVINKKLSLVEFINETIIKYLEEEFII